MLNPGRVRIVCVGLEEVDTPVWLIGEGRVFSQTTGGGWFPS